MYINPQTNIKLLKNVPLDTTYEHTIYFSSKSAQTSYFSGLVKHNLNNYTYQRVKRGYARVGIKSDSLYDCNYMMFQNTAYGTKWFYAFITSVEYINDECSEIQFEIDVMQTWFFDYNMNTCFVAREHSVSDNLHENLLPEPVEIGELVFNDTVKAMSPFSNLAVIIAIIKDSGGENTTLANGKVYDGVYGGATLFAYNISDTESINKKIAEYAQKEGNIVSIYTVPVVATESAIPEGGEELGGNASPYHHVFEFDNITGTETLNGYRPKNKKLYSYPYNMISVTTPNGGELKTRFEFFTSKPEFDIYCSVTQPVQATVFPKGYKGSERIVNECITINTFPICSWSVDSYQAWIAQQGVASINRMISTTLSGAMIGGATGAGIGLVKGVSDLLMSNYQASIASDDSHGNFNNGGVASGAKINQFYIGRKCCKSQYARVIDDFFSRFGYATNRLKTPNRNSRPHWNYVQTVDCTLSGSIPADDMRKICSIYNQGVTFWKKGSEVGNYSLDNSPS